MHSLGTGGTYPVTGVLSPGPNTPRRVMAEETETPELEHLPDTRLSAELRGFLDQLDGQDTTVGALMDLIADRGFGLLLLILALPAALPVPAPGYATPFGIAMVILGSQMIIGRTTPWLPDFIRNRTIPYTMLEFSVRNGTIPLKVVEFLIRPRLSGLSRSRSFLSLLGVIIVLMSACMSLPIPLTNTAPSFVIFVLAAGILEEDGLTLLGGILLAPVAAAIAGLALYYALTLGVDAVEETLKPLIKQTLGLS